MEAKMSLYKHLRQIWKKPKQNTNWKERLVELRQEKSIVKLDRPTRLDRARSLGYKAKQGIFVVRIKVKRGKRQRPKFTAGRRSKHMRRKKIVGKSYQWIAEERVSKKYVNCEVLNSYHLIEDAEHKWYEVIMVDKNHPVIKKDKNLQWVNEKQHTKRALRGLTSAGRKSRGLRSNKGKGAEKIRPSLNANKRRAK